MSQKLVETGIFSYPSINATWVVGSLLNFVAGFLTIIRKEGSVFLQILYWYINLAAGISYLIFTCIWLFSSFMPDGNFVYWLILLSALASALSKIWAEIITVASVFKYMSSED
ncbi:MAG: hypothetical protein ACOYMB_03475 [Patescibacteria group bacterium]